MSITSRKQNHFDRMELGDRVSSGLFVENTRWTDRTGAQDLAGRADVIVYRSQDGWRI